MRNATLFLFFLAYPLHTFSPEAEQEKLSQEEITLLMGLIQERPSILYCAHQLEFLPPKSQAMITACLGKIGASNKVKKILDRE